MAMRITFTCKMGCNDGGKYDGLPKNDMNVNLKLLLYHELHKISPLIVGNYHEHLKLSAISIHSHPVVSQDDNGICPDEEFVVDSMNMHAVRL